MPTSTLPIHPVTGLSALDVIGGRPVWPILGGDGTGDGDTGDKPVEDADADEGGDTPAEESGAGADDTDADEKPTDADEAPKGSQADDPKLRAARNDAAKYRTEAAAAKKAVEELKSSLGKALGFVSADKDADPKEVAAKLTSALDDAKQSKVELAVYRSAGKDVDVDALLDSRAFASAIGKLDPSSDDFDSELKALVKKTVAGNPKYKAEPAVKVPDRSGADTGKGDRDNAGQLTYAEYQKLSPAERMKATKEGRADKVLGRSK